MTCSFTRSPLCRRAVLTTLFAFVCMLCTLGQTPLLAQAEEVTPVLGETTSDDQGGTESAQGQAGQGAVSEGSAATGEGTTEEAQATPESNEGAASSSESSADAGSTAADAASSTDESQKTGQPSQTNSAKRVVEVTVDVAFVGPDEEWARVSGISLAEGSDAWDATLYGLAQSGLDYETGSYVSSDVLVSLTRGGDQYLASDASSGSGWHLYVNGEHYQGSASTYALRDGDQVEWRYEYATVNVTVSVIGPGGTGLDYWIAPTSVEVPSVQSGWDASVAVFEQNGYGSGRLLSYTVEDDGSVVMESLASLGSNGITGESWQVFVNGRVPEEDIAHVQIHEGDSICWYYAGNGVSSLPTFAEKTGAASQNPAARVFIDGVISQAWVHAMGREIGSQSLSSRLGVASGVVVTGTGSSGLSSYALTRLGLHDSLDSVSEVRPWRKSLSYTLSTKVNTGQGGRATIGGDGSLYYLDGQDSLVKLEVL